MKNKIIKIISLLIIILIVFIYLSFNGNPISKSMANKSINSYLDKNYLGLNIEKSRVNYNFKNKRYFAKLETNGIDTYFYIETDYMGKIVYDSYDRDVLGGFNTYNRLSKEYMDFVEYKIQGFEDLDFGIGSFIVNDNESIKKLEVNRLYSIEEIPLEKEVSIYVYDEPTIDNMVFWIGKLDGNFKENELDRMSISIRSVSEPLEELWLNSFSRELIDGNLEENIRKNFRNTELEERKMYK